jgi:hypothetical protein
MTVTESIKEIIEENAEALNRHEYLIVEVIVQGQKAKRLDYKVQVKKK